MPGAQIECECGCRPAQTVQAAVPKKSKPMTIQTRKFIFFRIAATAFVRLIEFDPQPSALDRLFPLVRARSAVGSPSFVHP